MFLSDTQFQKTSGVTRRCYAVFSRVNSILSDNQPCLLQNTLPIRQLRLYAGLFLYSKLCAIILRQLRSIVVVTPPITAITPVFRGKSPFFQLFSRLSSHTPQQKSDLRPDSHSHLYHQISHNTGKTLTYRLRIFIMILSTAFSLYSVFCTLTLRVRNRHP
jgi:hypothetical protein